MWQDLPTLVAVIVAVQVLSVGLVLVGFKLYLRARIRKLRRILDSPGRPLDLSGAEPFDPAADLEREAEALARKELDRP
jgi:hypothetical protein